MVLEIGEKDLQSGSFARQESLDRCTVIFPPPPRVDEIQDHLLGLGYQFLEALVVPREGSYPDDAGQGVGMRGHEVQMLSHPTSGGKGGKDEKERKGRTTEPPHPESAKRPRDLFRQLQILQRRSLAALAMRDSPAESRPSRPPRTLAWPSDPRLYFRATTDYDAPATEETRRHELRQTGSYGQAPGPRKGHRIYQGTGGPAHRADQLPDRPLPDPFEG